MNDLNSVGYCILCGQCFPLSYIIDDADKLGTMKLLPLLMTSGFKEQDELPESAFFSVISSNTMLCVHCAPNQIIWGQRIYKKHASCQLFYLYSEENLVLFLGTHMKTCPGKLPNNIPMQYLRPQLVPALIRRSQL